MKQRNNVVRFMNSVNKNAIHKNKKREFELNDDSHIKEYLIEEENMLVVEKGNLIDLLENDEIDVLIMQANCLGTMYKKCSAGLARALEQYPEVCEADGTYTAGDINQLGKFIIVPIKTKSGLDKLIVNVYSQYTVGLQNGTSPTSYLAMKNALKNLCHVLNKNYNTNGKLRCGSYLLGTGLGRADPEKVSEIMTQTLKGLNVRYYTI